MNTLPSQIKTELVLYKLGLPILLFIAGLVCLLLSFYQQDYYAFFMLDEQSPVTTGTIIDRWEDSYNEDGEVTMYGYEYTFYSPAGERITWASFSSKPHIKKGDKIKIQYNASEPRVNRAVGMKSSANFPVFIFFAALAFIGAVIWFFKDKYLQTKHLLENGRLVYGELIRKRKTHLSSDNDPVFELAFRFTTYDGKDTVSYINTDYTEEAEDDPRELLVYLESNPKKILLADSFSGYIKDFLYEKYKSEKDKKQSV